MVVLQRMTDVEVVWMSESEVPQGGPRGDEPVLEPAPVLSVAEQLAGAERAPDVVVDGTTGAGLLREKVAAGVALTGEEETAALRIGLPVRLRAGVPLVGQACPACGGRFVPGDVVHFAVGGDDDPGHVLVHEGEALPVSVADTETEAVHPLFAGVADRDPGDETDDGPRPGDFAHASTPGGVSAYTAKVLLSEPLEPLDENVRGGVDFGRKVSAGPEVRIPIVDAGHVGEALSKLVLDDDDLVRLTRAVYQPGDLTGELEAFVSVDDVRSLVASLAAERAHNKRISADYLERNGPVFEACMELALVAALAELERLDRNVVRVDANDIATMLVARGPLAGELAAWADEKTKR